MKKAGTLQGPGFSRAMRSTWFTSWAGPSCRRKLALQLAIQGARVRVGPRAGRHPRRDDERRFLVVDEQFHRESNAEGLVGLRFAGTLGRV